MLRELAEVIEGLSLPVVAGTFNKSTFAQGIEIDYEEVGGKDDFMHNAAAVFCFIHADRWLAEFAPTELATVVHEDGPRAKPMIKKVLRALRSREFAAHSLEQMRQAHVNLPLKRIIDTANFLEKPDARPLQLADLCAFILGRHLKGLHVPEDVRDIIFRHMSWMPHLQEKAMSSFPNVGQ